MPDRARCSRRTTHPLGRSSSEIPRPLAGLLLSLAAGLVLPLAASAAMATVGDDRRPENPRGDVDGELRGTDQPEVPDRFPGAHFDLGFDEFLGAPTSIFADGFESGTIGAWSP